MKATMGGESHDGLHERVFVGVEGAQKAPRKLEFSSPSVRAIVPF